MDGNYISREEHEEFRRSLDSEYKRVEDENNRQNERLKLLEDSIERISAINSSVEKLAGNMARMLDEQVDQGKRLTALEGRDGEMWRKAVGYIAVAIIGAIIGFIFKQIGM